MQISIRTASKMVTKEKTLDRKTVVVKNYQKFMNVRRPTHRKTDKAFYKGGKRFCWFKL